MGSQTGKSKSLRVSEELRTVQLVFEILLTISSLDESGFCFNIAKTIISVPFKVTSKVTQGMTFLSLCSCGLYRINLKPFLLFSWEMKFYKHENQIFFSNKWIETNREASAMAKKPASGIVPMVQKINKWMT